MSLDFLIFKDRKHQLQRCESLSSPPIRILNKNGIKNCTFFVDWIFQKLNYSLTGLWLKQAPHAKRMHMSGNYTHNFKDLEGVKHEDFFIIPTYLLKFNFSFHDYIFMHR